MRWRVYGATALLVLGVGWVGAGAETGNVWPAVVGYVLLLFVPALIVDAVRHG